MRILGLLLVILTVSGAAGCGYNFAGMVPVRLPENVELLNISEVRNPTQEVWLEAYLRSNFRDEISRRAEVAWVDENEAEALVHIQVERLRTSDGLIGIDDRLVRVDVRLDLEIIMFNARTKERIWSSGIVRGTSSYHVAREEIFVPGEPGPAHRQAVEEAVDDALRRATDRLGHVF